MLIRGYNNHGFEAWTIPTLYMVGKYLRLFAIKSDAERSKQAVVIPTGTAALMQDDFDPEADKQAQLRDCEQHLKRIFTLCLNDRYKSLTPALRPRANIEQSTTGRVEKVGDILYYQPTLQNLLQTQLCFPIENYSEDSGSIQQ